MRWIALLLLALAMFCAYIFMDILSPIKDLMMLPVEQGGMGLYGIRYDAGLGDIP